MPKFISRWIASGSAISERLETVVGWYLLSLMMESKKHSLTFAASISGLHKAQFSRLLLNVALAKDSFLLLSRALALQLSESRRILIPGSQWSVLLIVDSTLHRRSSRHVQNSQRFNHGGGYVIGHQWTNVIVVINDRTIPLPPIAFLSKNECKRRGIPYETEHTQVLEYLENLNLTLWIGVHKSSEVVVLMDSGYGDKRILKAIRARGWHWICALKSNRTVQTVSGAKANHRRWYSIKELFRSARKQAPFQTIRDLQGLGNRSKKKRKEFRARRLIGTLKKIPFKVAFVCSEIPKQKSRIFLACSNLRVDTRTIVLGYRQRWWVELFHRATKFNFGLQDAGVKEFDSVISHVHWVYTAYLLFQEDGAKANIGIEQGQRRLRNQHDSKYYREIIQLCTRYGNKEDIKNYCEEALAEMEVAA
jgi:hypothetical protein